MHHLEPKVGTFRISFRNFTTGASHSFGGTYAELVPGEIWVTVTLKPVSVGTDINITQEGLPDVMPVEACYLGWQESLENLARLVEPEINS